MTCPSCQSEAYQVCKHENVTDVAVCMECGELFIAETRAQPLKTMCDDCAFRPESSERADPYRWAEILDATIINPSGPFYCHKGLRCTLDAEAGTINYHPSDIASGMKPCAGWWSRMMAYKAGKPAGEL